MYNKSETPQNNRYETDESSHKSSLHISRANKRLELSIDGGGQGVMVHHTKFPSVIGGVSTMLSPLAVLEPRLVTKSVKPTSEVATQPLTTALKSGTVEICVASNEFNLHTELQAREHNAASIRRSSGYVLAPSSRRVP